MSARARRPTDLGTGAGAVDMRGQYAPHRTVPPPGTSAPEPVDPGDGGGSERLARPGTPIPVARGDERSEPIRVISMKAQTEARQRQSDPPQAPLHVQLRSLAEVSRRRVDTPPAGLGHLAPPRDPREVRARRLRADLRWGCVALALAAVITLAIWLVAGR